MKFTFRSVLAWALVLQLGAVVAAAQPQKVSREAAQQESQNSSPAPLEEEVTGARVVIDGRVVLHIYASIGGVTAADRAEAIRDRIVQLANTRSIPVESLHVEERDAWSEIRSGDDLIMAITEADAEAAGAVRQHLAAEDAELIRRTVLRYREEHTWKKLLLGVLYTALITVALLVLLRTLWKIRGLMLTRFERWMSLHVKHAGEGPRWSVSLAYLWRPLLILVKAFGWLVVIGLLQAYIATVLRFFPQTQQTSLQTTSWLSSQLAAFGRAVVDYLPNLILVIAIVVITYLVLGLNRQIFRDIETGRLKISKFYPDWAHPTANLVRLLVLALAAVVVFPYLPGSKSPAFQGITIFLGVLLSLGSSSAVANAVAGTILNYTRSFQVGDMVKIGDTLGQVLEKGLLVTRIETQKKEVITIPNGLVMGAAVQNYSTEAKAGGVTFHTTVTIGYDAPWRKVHELLISAALATQYILKDPAPFVLQTALNDFFVSYELNANTVRPDKMQELYSDLHQNIQDKFNEAGVEIASPHFTALRDGNTTTIPAGYRSGSYQPPAFRVRAVDPQDDQG
ncbi:MAG TPA: mechanosensitive ion channel domain-containing protein [Terriglobia bacterium]|nr:mechanosensitive ion channel domain-containing protein [Terriglobia bacterium]